jgi:ABC-type spermidine/putrescine transport system permease subunit II
VSRRQTLGRSLEIGTHRALVTAQALFLIGPVILTIFLSFSGEELFRFPPREWGLLQYRGLLESPTWLHSIKLSLTVAIPSAFLALAIGVAASFGLARTRLPGSGVLRFAGLSPMVIPVTALAVSLYGIYARLGLLATFRGLVIAHTVLGVPFVIAIVESAINRIPRELELAAMSLGASRWRSSVGITGRLLLPAAAAAFVFAFLTSFDEATLVTFLGGPGLITLPKAIFDSVRFTIDPVVTAIASLLIVSTAILIVLSAWLRRERA